MLTFGPDSTEQLVLIPITNDTVYEQLVEEFISNLVLVTDNANVIVRPARATVRIFDDDSKCGSKAWRMFKICFSISSTSSSV